MFKDDLNVPLNAAQIGQKKQWRDIAASTEANEVIDDGKVLKVNNRWPELTEIIRSLFNS